MADPYKILGVSQNADMDDIKKQYRNLCRKYHPDANINNPDKDRAEEKFKEIQAAYHQIVKDRERGYTGGYDEGAGNSRTAYDDDPFGFGGFGFGGFGGFNNRRDASAYNNSANYIVAAANYISARRYKEALNTLSNVDTDDRDAEWYYYSALANSGMGNNVAALTHAKTACRLNPSDSRYTDLVEMIEAGGRWYAGRQGGYSEASGLGRICLYCLCMQCCTGGGGFLCCL